MANYEVEILVRGRPVKVFKHKGDHFIEGRKGSTFELRITNNTWNRIEVVASVDGLSVINGEECGHESDGYVVPAKDSVIIPGWKLPDDKAAEFVFEDKRGSYSNQVGKGTSNVGVIGVMVFEEKEAVKPVVITIPQPYPQPYPVPVPCPDPWYPDPWPTRPWKYDRFWISTTDGDPNFGIRGTTCSANTTNDSSLSENSSKDAGSDTNIPIDLGVKGSGKVDIDYSDVAGSASITSTENLSVSNSIDDTMFGGTLNVKAMSASLKVESTPEFEIGTGWGKEVDHEVTMVEFERKNSNTPTQMLALFYDTKKGLTARGIVLTKTRKKKSKQLPNAFPTYKNTGCKPPRNWKG